MLLVFTMTSCTEDTPSPIMPGGNKSENSVSTSSTNSTESDTTSDPTNVDEPSITETDSNTITTPTSQNSDSGGKTTTTTKATTKPTSKATTKVPITTKAPTKAPTTTKATQAPVGRTWKYEAAMSDELFKLVNDYRASQSVAKLAYDSTCAAGAKTRAEYNAKNDILSDHGLSQIGTGGNTKNTAQGLFENWKNSPKHRQNMIETFFIEGGGAIYSDSRGYFYAIFQFSDGWD